MSLTFDWKIPIDVPPGRLWDYIADTNRLNQYAGLPEFTFHYIPEEDGGSKQVGEMSYLGWRLHWVEHPFEWVAGKYYEVIRAYENGPIRKFHTVVTLSPNNGGSLVHQVITCEPRWYLAIPLLYWQIGFSSRRRFRAAYRRIETFLRANPESSIVPVPRVAIPSSRLDIIRKRMSNAGGREWLPQLIDALETMPDEELDAMRPFVFADRWNADRREVLKLFLHASWAGLLDLSWDVICPSCRGAQERHDSLKKMKGEVHCPACNIRFDADFSGSVEVRFRPNPSIRRVEIARYCSGGPMNAPQIIAQQYIPARTSRTLEMRLSAWRYQVRSFKLDTLSTVQISADAKTSSATIKIHRPTLEPPALELSPSMSLTLENNDDQDICVMVERMAGNENAATAAMVTAMSEFRELFSADVLAPDTPISVGAVTLMFTDLKASTAMYEEIGEAPAYALVRRHFSLLRESIAKCEGTVVKTIGDSVMAVFFDPARAVQAAIQMQRTINEDNAARGKSELKLKIGIHHGSCIAVNTNDVLDYFGTAVNVAARIERESQGGDIVVSEDIWKDPQVQEVLAHQLYSFQQLECTLRGLTGKKTIYRIGLDNPAQ